MNCKNISKYLIVQYFLSNKWNKNGSVCNIKLYQFEDQRTNFKYLDQTFLTPYHEENTFSQLCEQKHMVVINPKKPAHQRICETKM